MREEGLQVRGGAPGEGAGLQVREEGLQVREEGLQVREEGLQVRGRGSN